MTTAGMKLNGKERETFEESKRRLPEDRIEGNMQEESHDRERVLEPPPNQDANEERWNRRDRPGYRRPQQTPSKNQSSTPSEKPRSKRLPNQVYTVSYLILFAIFGTLARLGVQWITNYPNAPAIISELWANVGGCVVMGFLQQDRALFEPRRGSALLHAIRDPETMDGLANSPLPHNEDLKRKKTLPLYIGLSVGFCGSFTSFSSFVRDAFLALSNDLSGKNAAHLPRNAGWSVSAVLAVLILETGLSLAAFSFGSHIALATTPLLARLPKLHSDRLLDPLATILGPSCWLGAVFLAIFAPRNTWRGDVLFALIFAPLGCLLRFYLSLSLNPRLVKFPLGTFLANILGVLVLGMSYDLQHAGASVAGVAGCQVLQGVQDGFCGCLTTVSTWVAELKALRMKHAYIYGFASVAVGFCCLMVIIGSLRWTVGLQTPVCTT